MNVIERKNYTCDHAYAQRKIGCISCDHADAQRKKGNQIRCKRFSRWVHAYGETCEEYIERFIADFVKEIEKECNK